MKTLSVLLLLALGTAGLWWKLSYPDATVREGAAQLADVGARLGDVLDTTREELTSRAVALAGSVRGESATAPADVMADAEPTSEVGTASPADTLRVEAPVPAPGPSTATLTPPRPPAASPSEPGAGTRDTLVTRLDAIENQLTATMSEAESSVVQGRLTDAERRLDAAAERERELLSRLDSLDTRLGSIDGRLGELDAIAEQIAALDARTGEREASTDDALAALEARDESLAARLDTLAATRTSSSDDGLFPGDPDGGRDLDDGDADAGTGDAGDTEPALAGAAPASAARLDALAAGLDRRFSALEKRLGSAATDENGQLDALAERLSERLAAAEATDARLSDALGSLDERVNALTALPERPSVDALQADIRNELTALGERVDGQASTGDAPALGEELTRTRERLETLEDRVQTLPAASAAADEAQATQSALEAQVRALEARLESLSNGPDPTIVNSISAVREQVDALESRGFVTQDELRAQVEGRNVEYKIYFERGSTDISDDAAKVLDSFIAQEKNRTSGVSIFGFTDRRGSASYNQRLALERATNVRSYLIQNGLPYNKIRALSGLGEDAAAAILPDDAEDAQQRVVVLYAAQP